MYIHICTYINIDVYAYVYTCKHTYIYSNHVHICISDTMVWKAWSTISICFIVAFAILGIDTMAGILSPNPSLSLSRARSLTHSLSLSLSLAVSFVVSISLSLSLSLSLCLFRAVSLSLFLSLSLLALAFPCSTRPLSHAVESARERKVVSARGRDRENQKDLSVSLLIYIYECIYAYL